eukprot:4590567-Prymnesium_polylepis.1
MYEELRAQSESQYAEPDPSRLLAAACHISSALARAWRGHARRSLTNVVNQRIANASEARSLALAGRWLAQLAKLH